MSMQTVVLLVLSACLLAPPAMASELAGLVVDVADGVTLTLLVDDTRHKVRLSNVDAPDPAHPFADSARTQLSDLVLGRQVRVECRGIDHRGRIIGRVHATPASCPGCGLTLDVGLALLTTGSATWQPDDATEQPEEERGQYEFGEFEARSRKVGLWGDANATRSGARSPSP